MMKSFLELISRKRLRKVATNVALASGIFAAIATTYFFIPPPHQARAQFAAQGTWAGTAGGTANAIVLTLANVATLNDIIGVPITFNPSASNSGPVTVAITNALGTTTPTALQRPSSIGLTALSLNEIWNGETTSVMYNGTVFVLSSNVDMTRIGEHVPFRGSSAPRGTLIEDGSCYPQTTYAALFSVIGTTYNAAAPVSCSGSQFAVPDSRGSLFAALDNQGANGAASRITNSDSGCTATAVGTRCGADKQTLTVPQLPVFTPSPATNTLGAASAGSAQANSGSGSAAYIPGSSFGTMTFNSIGSGNAHPILNPVLLGLTAIKY
jgi:microcystin-dependent protein